MSIPGQSWWQIVEDGLLTYITEATQNGGVLAVQPNPDGSTGIKLVDNVDAPEQNIFPSIGIMCQVADEQQAALDRHDVVAKFTITIAVLAQMDALQPTASLKKVALAALRNYQNDANGNGIEPLLRAQTFLQGFPGFQWGLITHMERYALENEAGAADILAVAIYTYEAHGQATLWN